MPENAPDTEATHPDQLTENEIPDSISAAEVARYRFSRAFAASLDKTGHARFQLRLPSEAAQALLLELESFRFNRWSCQSQTGDAITAMEFHVDLRLPTPAPSITVVISSYNNSQTELERSTSSALRALDHAAFGSLSEVMVVDDASERPAESHFKDREIDPRLRFTRRDRNQGVSASRNHGARLARHPIVVYLDADDEISPSHLLALVSQITAGAEVAASDMQIRPGHDIILAHARGVPDIFMQNSFGSGIALNLDGPTIRKLRRWQPLYNPLFRVCYEDWELNSVLWLLGASISIVPLPSYLYHRSEAGRDSRARRFHPYFKRLLPHSANLRTKLVRLTTSTSRK